MRRHHLDACATRRLSGGAASWPASRGFAVARCGALATRSLGSRSLVGSGLRIDRVRLPADEAARI